MATEALQRRPSARRDLVTVEIDGEMVVLDRRGGGLHLLNTTASAVLVGCDGSATVDELSRELAETFGAPLRNVNQDVLSALDVLEDADLLRPTGDRDGGCVGCQTA
jgi:hypothetical protein